jgi:predicted aldo/keto reductase-like oxidoreductase
LPCQEGIEIGWVIWDLDQIPVKASACVECGVCLERCPFDVEIIDKMREAAVLFEAQAA